MPRAAAGQPALLCPGCGLRFHARERFCPDCSLPLVLARPGDRVMATTERQRRARLIKPQLAEGELVRVTSARHQAEAEFISALLLEEGVPSLVRRSAGFDVPDMLAAGPRDLLVPAAALVTAREVLLQAELIDDATPGGAPVRPARLLVGLLVALALGAVIIWLISRLGQ